MTYFDERLKELYQQKLEKRRLESMETELMRQEEVVTEKTAELEIIKRKEEVDVEKLTGKSIKALIASIAGNKEEKLSKERQEAYAAAMKYEAAKRDLEGIEADLASCRERLEQLQACEEEYIDLMEQKKEALKKEGSLKANEILRMEKEMAALEHDILEAEEALDVGYRAYDIIKQILDELEEAHNMADWDTFTDSFWIDSLKHEHIHNAQDLIEDLRKELRNFKTELADVQIEGNIQIDIDDFSEFADWFFDNFFTDWNIREKIENSQTEAQETKEQIKGTINTLKDMRDACMKRRVELQDELEALVVK